MPERVVFDCGVFFQSLIAPRGPAGLCLSAASDGKLQLFVSNYVLAELRDVCSRPQLAGRFKLTPERIAKFIGHIKEAAIELDNVPHVFDYPRDPDDEHYVDLAVVAQARLIVSRDNDLLALENPKSKTGRTFHERFPELSILTPDQMLKRLHHEP